MISAIQFKVMNFLAKVIKEKKLEVQAAKRKVPLNQMAILAMQAKRAIKHRSLAKAVSGKPLSLIAEIKLISPSLGRLSSRSFLKFAKIYAKSNARSISVLTDGPHFGGSLEHLKLAREICPQPILRKDFIIDEYQIYQSKLLGADAALLIAASLPEAKLKQLLARACKIGLDCLVEVHSATDLKKALQAGAKIIGINNRDLKSLKINLQTTVKLMRLMPKGKLVVSESGISGKAEAQLMHAAGANAILAGGAIMQAKNPAAKIEELTRLP